MLEHTDLDVRLDRDTFLRQLLRDLAGTLEDLIGDDAAEGYISLVGTSVGRRLNELYRAFYRADNLSQEQVVTALVDLKKKIEGDFYIIEADEEKIVLGNRKCPFGEYVNGRPSLCMMTSNVFGRIAADNLGYAKVDIQKAIARGDSGCRVVVHLKRNKESVPDAREYFHVDLDADD